MPEAAFYHLTRQRPEEALLDLVPRARGRGWRLGIRGGDEERLKWLDEKLWLGPKESFLPHGLEGGAHDARQPILLGARATANDPQCLFVIDGATVSEDDVSARDRVAILFDGGDERAVSDARALWSALTGAGLPARYWSQESGRWEEKASKNV